MIEKIMEKLVLTFVYGFFIIIFAEVILFYLERLT